MNSDDLLLPLSDEEETTASKVLQQLTVAWINEKYSPQLLKHESDLIDIIMDQIHQMEENLRNLHKDDFRLVPHQMEVDRMRYVISSYLRTRLEKIETFVVYVLKRDKNIPNLDDRYLSNGEFKFAEEFLANMKEHCHVEVFKYMPTLLQDYGENAAYMEVKPNLNSTIFIRMVKTVIGALVDDQIVDLMAGSRHLLPYKDVLEYIQNGSAQLI